MLKIMKNEEEIFRAWLKKYLNDGGGLNGKQLADAMDISSSRLSYIVKGRKKETGERYFPKFPFDLRQAALKATGVAYEAAVQIGQEERNPIKDDMKDQIGETVRNELRALMPGLTCQANSNITTIEQEHVKVIQQFQQKELALEINQLLLAVEKNNPALLEVIRQQLSGMAAECHPAPQKKRPAANDKD